MSTANTQASAKEMISQRRYQDAIRACRHQLLLGPDEDVQLLLGHALLAVGRYEDVRREMRALLKTSPERAEAHRVLGETLLRLGDEVEAAVSLRAAQHLDPSDDEARELLSELREIEEEGLDPFEGEPTQTEAPKVSSDRVLPSLEDVVFDDPTYTANIVLPDYEASIEIDSDFGREISGFEELEGEATMMTDPGGPLPPERSSRPGSAPGSAPGSTGTLGAASLLPNDVDSTYSDETAEDADLPDIPTQKKSSFPAKIVFPRPAPVSSLSAELLSADLLMSDDAAPLPELEDEPTRARASMPLGSGGEMTAPRDPLDEQATNRVASMPQSRKKVPSAPQAPPRIGGALPSLQPPERQRPSGLGPKAPPKPLPPLGAPPPPIAPPPKRSLPSLPSLTGPKNPNLGPPRVVKAGPPAPIKPQAGAPHANPIGLGAGLPDFGDGDLEGEPTRTRSPGFSDLAPVSTPMGMGSLSREMSLPGMETPPMETPTVAPPSRAHSQPQSQSQSQSQPRSQPAAKRWPLAVIAAMLGAPMLLLALVVLGIRLHTASVAGEDAAMAARTAANEGTLVTLQAALLSDQAAGSDEPAAIARRAFLYSLAVVEHGSSDTSNVDSVLMQAPGELPLAILGRAYLDLEAGRVADADQRLRALSSTESGGEVIFARSLIALQKGDWDEAVQFARAAQSQQPAATRYTAGLARALLAHGDLEQATQLAGGLQGAAQSSMVGLVQAEVKMANGEFEPARNAALAVAMMPHISERARAKAHLLAAMAALGLEQPEVAAADLANLPADAVLPLGNERWTLTLIDAFVGAGLADKARDTIALLPEYVANAGLRSTSVATVFLLLEDYERVAVELQSAPDSPRTAFLRGRLAEAQEDTEGARRAYEAAAASPAEAFRARVRLGVIALAADEPEEAAREFERVRARHLGDADLVSGLVTALLALERNDEAGEVVSQARSANPEDTRIRMAEADVHVAREEFDQALESLEAVVLARANDGVAHARLGQIALSADNPERAQTAFARALELNPRDRTALLGVVQLARRQADPEAMDAAILAAEQARVTGRPIDLARAALSLLRGEGRAAVALFSPLARRSRDPELLADLGFAQLQAESNSDARRSFRSALRRDRRHFRSLIGMSIVETRQGRLRAARDQINTARRAVQGDQQEAQLLVARARLDLEYGRYGDAETKARQALEKDTHSSEAHFLLAMAADAQGNSSVAELRLALEGRAPFPEVLGQLVIHGPRDEQCDLAERYFRAAPRGVDSRDVERAARRCR